MSTAGEGNRGGAVRVVIITTRYIHTDPDNFKSVVQRLTGKHSRGFDCDYQPPPQQRPRLMIPPPPSVSGTDGSSDMISRRVSSLSDLDRLPSWEEISQLCI